MSEYCSNCAGVAERYEDQVDRLDKRIRALYALLHRWYDDPGLPESPAELEIQDVLVEDTRIALGLAKGGATLTVPETATTFLEDVMEHDSQSETACEPEKDWRERRLDRETKGEQG